MFPGADSVIHTKTLNVLLKKIQKFLFLIYFKKPSLCYVNQNGSKWYDADNAKAIKEYLDVQTPLGTTTSEVRMKTNHHNSKFLDFSWFD